MLPYLEHVMTDDKLQRMKKCLFDAHVHFSAHIFHANTGLGCRHQSLGQVYGHLERFLQPPRRGTLQQRFALSVGNGNLAFVRGPIGSLLGTIFGVGNLGIRHRFESAGKSSGNRRKACGQGMPVSRCFGSRGSMRCMTDEY